jgi:hypothetical protein
MPDDCPHLTLEELNRTTQAWVEMEYQRRIHSEIGTAPLTRYTKIRDVGRPCPGSEKLRQSFTIRLTRRARSSDGTISLEGTRFELPNRLRNLQQVTLRYARWDLRYVWVIDPNTDVVIAPIYPLDKQANADRQRRAIDPPSLAPEPVGEGGVAPCCGNCCASTPPPVCRRPTCRPRSRCSHEGPPLCALRPQVESLHLHPPGGALGERRRLRRSSVARLGTASPALCVCWSTG